MLISPSILSSNFCRLEDEVKAVAAAGADWLHVDVMDGHFVPNITIGVPVVAALKKTTPLPLDVHLMIEKPEKFVTAFIDAGADWLTIHVESTADPAAVLKSIRARGIKAGITLRPATPIEQIIPFLGMVDLVLVMTVDPGFSGQAFMPEQVAKLNSLIQLRQEKALKFLIQVDGGVNEKTVEQLRGADVLVSGNFIFKNDYRTAIRVLKGI